MIPHGNVGSVIGALRAAGATDIELGSHGDKVVIPGQGTARSVLQHIGDWISRKPVLAICAGMQVLYEYSEELDTQCLGIVPGKVTKLPRIRMGWDRVGDDWFYFAHSYAHVANGSVTNMVRVGNITGVQFHPEKSGAAGISFYRDWLGNA